jgi:hypothetical protein
VILQRLRERWLGVGESAASRALADPEHAWTLVERPDYWGLWMPRVESLLDPVRPLRPGARFRVALRVQRGRFGAAPEGTGHVVVEGYLPGRELRWALVAGKLVERFSLERGGGQFRLTASGSARADAVLAELDRQST